MLADPHTGEPLQERAASSPGSVDAAIAAAAGLHESRGWSGLDVPTRAALMHSFAGELDARVDAIADADHLTTGVPRAVTGGIAGSLAGTVTEAVRLMVTSEPTEQLEAGGRRVELQRTPAGPVAAIIPWNAPAPIAVSKLAAALAAGCPVVIKPSEWAPSSCNLIADAAVAAGLPAGLVSLVHGNGSVGEQLVGDPRIRAVLFTGSREAGRRIAAVAAPQMKVLQLELGSINPAIVLADADVPVAARRLVAGMTKLNGQWCEAPRRILVDRAIADDLVGALEREIAEAELGPLAYREHRERVRHQLNRLRSAGATIVQAPDERDGWWFRPALVTGVSPGTLESEIFAPVVVIHPFASEDEAVALANRPGGGLAAYVLGDCEADAFALGSRLEAGEVRINGTSVLNLAPGQEQSFFAESGVGMHNTRATIRLLQASRTVGIDDPSPPI